MKKKSFILFVSVFLLSTASAQTRVTDSLKQLIATTRNDEQKLNAILRLNEQSLNADSLLPYILTAEQAAARSGTAQAKAKAAFCRAGYYARKNLLDSAAAIMDQLILQQQKQGSDKALYLEFLFFRAKLYDRANQYGKALRQLYHVIETAASLKDTLILIQAKTGIGWVLIEMEQYEEALKWLHSAKQTSSNRSYYKNYGALYSNMATAFNAMGNRDSAIYFINYAIKDARESENLLFLATALSIQGKIFVDNGMLAEAEKPFNDALQLRKKLEDPFYLVFDMSNLASYYAKNNQPQKGIQLCQEGIALAKALGLPSQLMMIYKALAENHKVAGNEQEYGQTLEQIILLKDSFNHINSAKMLSELQAADDARKQEKTITEQKLNLVIKNYLLTGLVLFVIMAAAIAWLLFKNFKRRQQVHLHVAVEKEKFLAAQAVKDAEEQERKRIASDLHDSLGAQANAILYSTELLQQGAREEEPIVTGLHYTARDMLRSLRETLWALKSAETSATDVWLRIINFVKQLNRHYQDVTIFIEGAPPSHLKLSSTQALNIVFIVQEAVNNALRHASAQNIIVTSSFDGEYWTVRVQDNGKGFDLQAVAKKMDSYGLNNIKERAAAAHCHLTMETVMGEGTFLQLKRALAE